MARRSGPIDDEIRRIVQAYIVRHGHGSATVLAKTIKRSSAWVGLFIAGKRRVGIDDAVSIAKALNVDLYALILEKAVTDIAVLDLEPIDRREVALLRTFVKLQGHSRRIVINLAKSLLDMEQTLPPTGRGGGRPDNGSPL